MARRVVYGNSISENGWPIVDQQSCRWVVVPGTDPPVHLEIQDGWPAIVLGAFAADVNAYVEKLRDRDSACWTATNSVATSNHLGGTAMDLNWDGADGKTFRFQIPEEKAWPPPKNAVLREILDFYEDVVFCGGFWSIRDWMHFQMGGDTFNNPRTQNFIDRKIRPDGFSTFRRGGTPVPQPQPQPSADAVGVLARAAGLSTDWATKVLPQVREGLAASKCTTPRRIAMWLAQVGHESDDFRATEEYKKDGRYAPYIGRTWIQITWRENYAGFSVWCHARGLVPTESYFVDNPKALAEQKWAGLGPAWYWTVARPQINGMCDNGDIVGVTRAINGGTNGIDDRRTRYNRALALGDQLLVLTSTIPTTPPTTTPPTQEDDMSAEAERMIRELHAAFLTPGPSRSDLRTPGETNLFTVPELVRNIDGLLHPIAVDQRSELGDPREITRLHQVADTLDPVRTEDARLAASMLEKLTAGDAPRPSTPVEATVAAPDPALEERVRAAEERARIAEEKLRSIRAEQELAAVTVTNVANQPAPASAASTPGQLLGQAFDALAQLQLASQLPADIRAPLDALISILKTYPKDET